LVADLELAFSSSFFDVFMVELFVLTAEILMKN